VLQEQDLGNCPDVLIYTSSHDWLALIVAAKFFLNRQVICSQFYFHLFSTVWRNLYQSYQNSSHLYRESLAISSKFLRPRLLGAQFGRKIRNASGVPQIKQCASIKSCPVKLGFKKFSRFEGTPKLPQKAMVA